MGKRHFPKNWSHKAGKKGLGAAALAVCLVLFVILISAVIGRYQSQFGSDGSARALNFYFTSDLLDGGAHTLAPETTELSFTLGNHADELRFSEMDISYEVTVTPADGVTIEKGTATLTKNKKSDAKVTLKGLKPGEYTVTAVGEGGYSKTLTATVVIPEKKARLYWHQENVSGEYLLLTVWNEGGVAGKVTVNYIGIPDNTNPNMTDWVTADTDFASEEITIEPYESKVFRFFGGATVQVPGVETKEPR